MAACNLLVPKLDLAAGGAFAGGKDDASLLSTASQTSSRAASSPPCTPAATPPGTPRGSGFFLDVADVEVKNTFIHFSGAAPPDLPLRRTASCPASLISGSPAGCSPPAHEGAGSDGPAMSPEGAHAVSGTWPASDGAGLVAVILPALCSNCTCGVPPLPRRGQERECDERDVQQVIAAAHGGQLEWLRQMCYESTTSSAAVQEAIERAVAAPYDALACCTVDATLRALRGRVRDAVKHRHGNYVIQKIVESLPAIHVDLIAEELRGHGPSMARHPYGCRTMLRLFRHQSCGACAGGATRALLGEILEDFAEDPCSLLCHRYGTHVIHEALEHGLHPHRHRGADTACSDAIAGSLLENAHQAWPRIARGPGRSALRALLSSARYSEGALARLRGLVPVPASAGEGGLSEEQFGQCMRRLSRSRRS